MRKAIILAATVPFLAVTAQTQTKPIETDRPDQTESTAITPTGSFQFEHGFALEREGGISLIAHPATLVKCGVSERFEIRWVMEPVTTSGNGAPTTR
ncbi:MAG: hypothetical protein AABY75_06730, partial [Bacteroidota bacterium]